MEKNLKRIEKYKNNIYNQPKQEINYWHLYIS